MTLAVRPAALAASTAFVVASSLVGVAIAASPTNDAEHPTIAGSSVRSTPPIDVDELQGVLIGAAVLDVPTDWVIRDLDPTLTADVEQSAEFDPFLGLVSCADGTIREGADRQWLSRQFSATELPLENGLLSIELIVEVESDEEWERDRAALDGCETGEQSLLTVTDSELDLDRPADAPEDTSGSSAGATVPMTAIELLASPSSAVPYPSAFNAAIVHIDDRTVSVILGGVDMGESYQPLVEEITVVVLASVRPPDES